MSDVVLAVKHLVAKATTGGKDWELREAIDAVMTAFRPRDGRSTRAALDVLGKGVTSSQGRAEQVLLLALGALVEAGAPPELAWPSIEHKLAATISAAGNFVQECVDRTDVKSVDEAVRLETEGVKRDFPRDYAAWQVVRSKCMAASACLARSPKLRESVRRGAKLLKALRAAETLEEWIDEVRAFSRILRILHDEPLLVIHPESGKGFRFVMRDLTSNVELYALLLDHVAGDPKKGLLKGKRPNPKAIATLKDPDKAPKGQILLDVPFHTVGFPGLQADATLPDPTTSHETHHWVWLEGIPADIAPFEGERVILLQGPVMAREVEVEVPYDALFPSLKPKGRLTAAEVVRLLARMAKAAARLPKPKPVRPASPKPLSAATKRAVASKKLASKKVAAKKVAAKKVAAKKVAAGAKRPQKR